MADTLTSITVRAGGFIVEEGRFDRSREAITVMSGGGVLPTGRVLERVATGATATATARAGNTGNGTMSAVTAGDGAQPGTYQVVITEPAANGGVFEVEDPQGVVIGSGTVGAAFSGGGLSFTLADGATDFVAGDSFQIRVTGHGYQYRGYDPANTDAERAPAGVLYDQVDATSASVSAVAIVRDAVVNGGEIVWHDGATADQIASASEALADNLGVVVRDAV